jgi:hypothetical protein
VTQTSVAQTSVAQTPVAQASRPAHPRTTRIPNSPMPLPLAPHWRPRPLTPDPASEASLAHFPTFVMDITLPSPRQTGLPPDSSQFVASRVTMAAAAQSILNK